MPIRTCFFDMGNVLVYFSHQLMCENVAAVSNSPVDTVAEILLTSGLQFQLERGEICERRFHTEFEHRSGTTVDIDALKHATADIFRLNESIVPLLDELRSLGIRLVLLSNTSITHFEFIRQQFDVLNRFDDFTTSWQVGALKPDAAIYEDALRRANCDPRDCFYTDDIEDYVCRARKFGINAEVYTQTQNTRSALEKLGLKLT